MDEEDETGTPKVTMGTLLWRYVMMRREKEKAGLPVAGITPQELAHSLGIDASEIDNIFGSWHDLVSAGEKSVNKIHTNPEYSGSYRVADIAAEVTANITSLIHDGSDDKTNPGVPNPLVFTEQTVPTKPTTVRGLGPITDLEPATKGPTTLSYLLTTAEPTFDDAHLLAPAPRQAIPDAQYDEMAADVAPPVVSFKPSAPAREVSPPVASHSQYVPDSMPEENKKAVDKLIAEYMGEEAAEETAVPEVVLTDEQETNPVLVPIVAPPPPPLAVLVEGSPHTALNIDGSFKVVLSPKIPEQIPPRQDIQYDSAAEVVLSTYGPEVTADTPDENYSDYATEIVSFDTEKKERGFFGRLRDRLRRRKDESKIAVKQSLALQKKTAEEYSPQSVMRRRYTAMAVAGAALIMASSAAGALYSRFIGNGKSAAVATLPEAGTTELSGGVPMPAAQKSPIKALPDTLPKPETVICNDLEMSLKMHFDSTRFVDKDAEKMVEQYLLKAASMPRNGLDNKSIIMYVYPFASIEGPEDKANPKNDDSPYNIKLAEKIKQATANVVQKMAKKHGLDVIVMISANYAETEGWGKGKENYAENRRVVLKLKHLPDPDENPLVAKALVTREAGKLYPLPCPTFAENEPEDKNASPEHGSITPAGDNLEHKVLVMQNNRPTSMSGVLGSNSTRIIEQKKETEDKTYQTKTTVSAQGRPLCASGQIEICPSKTIVKQTETETKYTMSGERPVSASGQIESRPSKTIVKQTETGQTKYTMSGERPVSASGYIEKTAIPMEPEYSLPLGRLSVAVKGEIEAKPMKLDVYTNDPSVVYAPVKARTETAAALDELSSLISDLVPTPERAKAARLSHSNTEIADALEDIYNPGAADTSSNPEIIKRMMYPVSAQQTLLDSLDAKQGDTSEKDALLQDILYKKAA